MSDGWPWARPHVEHARTVRGLETEVASLREELERVKRANATQSAEWARLARELDDTRSQLDLALHWGAEAIGPAFRPVVVIGRSTGAVLAHEYEDAKCSSCLRYAINADGTCGQCGARYGEYVRQRARPPGPWPGPVCRVAGCGVTSCDCTDGTSWCAACRTESSVDETGRCVLCGARWATDTKIGVTP